jgi:hypothetical protein
MKQITLDDVLAKQKLLLTMLVMLSIVFFSIFAIAADEAAGAGDKTQTERTARDFNHLSTGFPLLGLHTTVECGSCHVAGIFKGTPKNCAGCHTKGMRVVATPKSLKHLVTTEPCEVCHTNAVTFYGARYNHGKAVTGQCTTCHNGVIATGRAASHSSGNKLTKSCDSCHRTYAWLPANWNHFGNTAACVTCHDVGKDGAAYRKIAIAGTSPEAFAHNALNASLSCESCHHNYSSWYGATYDHAAAGSVCSSCHNGSRATGKSSGHAVTTAECSECHIGTTSWSGALGAAPANHSALNTSSGCKVCHVGASTTHVTGSTLHTITNIPALTTCNNCHHSTAKTVTFSSASTSKHQSSAKQCSNSGCHSPGGSKGAAYTRWD